jgi:hypothetical protein
MTRQTTCLAALAAALVLGSGAAGAATVGYWRFEEGSGSSAADLSGNGNTGTLAGGAAFVSSVLYPEVLEQPNVFSLLLDGAGDAVSVADSNSLDVTTAFTVEAFVKRTGADVNFSGIVVKLNVAGNSPAYGLIFGSADGVRASAHVASPGTIGTATSPLALDTWHHVAGVYDGAQLRLYVDGVLKASVAGSGSVEVSTRAVTFGTFGADFQGQIDEVRISNVALAPEQFLRAPIFADGFEVDGTGDWSDVAP